MGGFGSGRRSGRPCTDEFRRLDVRAFGRAGCLAPGQSFQWGWWQGTERAASVDVRTAPRALLLSYRHRHGEGPWRDVRCQIDLDHTPCQLGGQRPWWLCPVVGCGKRVAVLYLGAVPACRHCHGAAYRSQRELPPDRLARQLDKLRERLGWEPGFLNGSGTKPKGMHWRTFWRLQAQHNSLTQEALEGYLSQLGLPPRAGRS